VLCWGGVDQDDQDLTRYTDENAKFRFQNHGASCKTIWKFAISYGLTSLLTKYPYVVIVVDFLQLNVDIHQRDHRTNNVLSIPI
jgi:hypothetical protein